MMKRRVALILVLMLVFSSVMPGFAESIRVRIEGKTETHYNEIYEIKDTDKTLWDVLNNSVNLASPGAIKISGGFINESYNEAPIWPAGYLGTIYKKKTINMLEV